MSGGAARYDLRGKAVLVTGAARGIGLETARGAHARGAADVEGRVGTELA